MRKSIDRKDVFVIYHRISLMRDRRKDRSEESCVSARFLSLKPETELIQQAAVEIKMDGWCEDLSFE
jgi:hypothetical protein